MHSNLVTALPTLFFEDGSIDFKGMDHLISILKSHEIHSFLPAGSTGEVLNLSDDERIAILEHMNRNWSQEIQLWCGVFYSSTADALRWIERVSHIKSIAHLLVITPYYIKPTQDALIAFYSTLADCAHRPLFLYNNPCRTGVSLELQSIVKLSQHPNILGIKESQANPQRIGSLLTQPKAGFQVYCGNDDYMFNTSCLGAAGSISALSCAMPGPIVKMHQALAIGKGDLALQLYRFLSTPLHSILKYPNPSMIKEICALRGWGRAYLRPPLSRVPLAIAQNILEEILEAEKQCQSLYKFITN